MAEPGLYDELSREQLDALCEERGIVVENGSGKDGNVLIGDVRAALETGDAETADGSTDYPDPVTPATADPPKKGRKVEITRQTDAAWWCPICDRSHAEPADRCDGCGAERDDDHVISAG